MAYVVEPVVVKRSLPGAAALLSMGSAPRRRCGCHNRSGLGDYNLGDQPNVSPVFPNLTPATPPAPLNIPILLPSSPVFSSVQMGSPSVSPSGGSSSSWLSLIPSLASVGTQIAGAASGGANVGSAPPPGSGLSQAQWNAMTPAQQQAEMQSYQAYIASGASSTSWFNQSNIIPGLSNGSVLLGGGAGVLLLIVILKAKK